MQAVDEVQDTPPSSVPPSQPPVLVVGVDWTVQLVPFQRSASGLRFLPVRVVAVPVAVHCDRPVQDTPSRYAPLKPGRRGGARPARSSSALRLAPARSQGASHRAAGLLTAAAALLDGMLPAAGDAAAGPAAIIAPARTVAVIPAPERQGRSPAARPGEADPPSGAALRGRCPIVAGHTGAGHAFACHAFLRWIRPPRNHLQTHQRRPNRVNGWQGTGSC